MSPCNYYSLPQHPFHYVTKLYFLLSDFNVTSDTQEYTLGIDETEVELDPITIIDDGFPEDNETFSLHLMEGEGGEFQNVFTDNTPSIVTIIDENGWFIHV